MRISDWSSDVCSSDLLFNIPKDHGPGPVDVLIQGYEEIISPDEWSITFNCVPGTPWTAGQVYLDGEVNPFVWIDTEGCVSGDTADTTQRQRSEEHTSDLQSLMRISYAVFCFQKQKIT